MRESFDDRVRKSFNAEVKAAGARRLRFTISTGGVDRQRDTIDPMGWELAAYRRNPVVLWAHDYGQPPVATATSINLEGERLMAEAEFATADQYPFANTVFELLRGGFLRATSVGFQPLEWTFNEQRGGFDFKRQELLEFSIVPVPANADALVEARSKGINTDPVEQWLTKRQRSTRRDDNFNFDLSSISAAALRRELGRENVLAGVNAEQVRAMIGEATTAALNRATGRLD